jgi:hypothetical protein
VHEGERRRTCRQRAGGDREGFLDRHAGDVSADQHLDVLGRLARVPAT